MRFATCAIAALLVWVPVDAPAQSPFDPPSATTLAEARELVRQMIRDPRGPYLRLRWFCNDGSVHPPRPYPCSERGGGRQHAEYSDQRARLAELGWSVGTIFAATDWSELWDEARRHQRLRELPLERYLIDIGDGWVLHEAQNYRGRVQLEDEEAAGRRLLLRLLADGDWVLRHFLLAREAVRVIPHTGAGEDRTRTVRRDATELANADPSFERLRVEIHTTPSALTAGRVRAWAEAKSDDLRESGSQLAQGLDALYGSAGRRARLEQQRTLLAADASTAALARDLVADGSAEARFVALTAWLRDARDTIANPITAEARLLLLDAAREVENELSVIAGQLLANEFLNRRRLLELGREFVDASYGAGLLTRGELDEIAANWPVVTADELTLGDYERALGLLRRVPQWAVGSVRYTFAEPLLRYSALDSRAATFVDDLLRGSTLSGLADVTRRLSRDFARLTGVTQRIDGRSDVPAFGLNAGVAVGRLRIFETAEALHDGDYQRTDIVLLPETVAELSRVAGIVTLGEGNPLSHVQLLARNFAIPNVAILPEVVPLLRPLEGVEILLAVAADGSVVLMPAAEADPGLRAQLRPANETASELTVARPDLSFREPIRLADLESALSGRVVGPKAANLGQLARLFPGRVAPAVAVPFGIFADHMNAGDNSLRDRLVSAYADFNNGALAESELLERLESIRRDIAALEVAPQYREALLAAMTEEFGRDVGSGLFLRSDTNVEDLPQFTGAGLSETLANVVGVERQIAAIPRIWASVLSPRAIAWRSNLLTNPEEVYASVLLMQSVPSTKSGVMVTANLATSGTGLTVSTGWGVGGAVAGEAVETIVLTADGTRTLVSEAKTAYQRGLDANGGIRWLPAADGRVISDDEALQLRRLADEVALRYTPVFDDRNRQRPWDIEFGFVDGELTLFQIRPLVERGAQLADRIVVGLTGRPVGALPEYVYLAELPGTE